MVQALLGISSAFGLATGAGLNAYIPLLIVALAARFPLNNPWLDLADPYTVMGSWWSIGILTVLLGIEMTVDKIPVMDTINDTIQTFVRPAAGAILFAANANVVTDIHPVLALGAGLVVAGGVHAAKGATRPMVTAVTAGTGNWLVSIIEDVASFFMSIFAIFLPVLAVILFVILAYFGVRWYRRRKKRQMAYQ